MSASQIAAAVGGTLIGPDVDVDGASFDSRSLQRGQLFVPIVAERDGHDFIPAAVAAGAAVHLRSHTVTAAADLGTAIEVADTAAALMDLAAWARGQLAATVVGITGSVGKTTTKDLTAAACGVARRTVANERSFNNEQGLPVTILGAPGDTEVLILEMGMRGFGHIETLCRVARPDIGLVTVVGESHTEMTGGLDGVARAKAELVASLPPTGTAVLNADDPRVAAMASATDAAVVTYGEAGDVRVTDVRLDGQARPTFRLDTPWGRTTVSLALPGRHMVANAAGAIAVAALVGVPVGDAAGALSSATVSAMRMETIRLAGGATILNDAYNANPTSMRAALDALAATEATRRIAVLGAMGELADPVLAHRGVADHARSLGIEVIAVGTDRYGSATVEDVASEIGALGAGTVVLVKASRAAGLERVVDELVRAAGSRSPA